MLAYYYYCHHHTLAVSHIRIHIYIIGINNHPGLVTFGARGFFPGFYDDGK